MATSLRFGLPSLCFTTLCVLLLQGVSAGRVAQGSTSWGLDVGTDAIKQINAPAGHDIRRGRCVSPFDYGWCCLTTGQCWISRRDCETYCPSKSPGSASVSPP